MSVIRVFTRLRPLIDVLSELRKRRRVFRVVLSLSEPDQGRSREFTSDDRSGNVRSIVHDRLHQVRRFRRRFIGRLDSLVGSRFHFRAFRVFRLFRHCSSPKFASRFAGTLRVSLVSRAFGSVSAPFFLLSSGSASSLRSFRARTKPSPERPGAFFPFAFVSRGNASSFRSFRLRTIIKEASEREGGPVGTHLTPHTSQA